MLSVGPPEPPRPLPEAVSSCRQLVRSRWLPMLELGKQPKLQPRDIGLIEVRG